MVSAFGDHSIKSFLPQNFLTPCLYIYYSSTSIISFKFLIHTEFILVYGTKQESKFSPCPLHLPLLLVPNLFDSGTYCSHFQIKQSQKGRSIHNYLRIETSTDAAASPCSKNFAEHKLWRGTMKKKRGIERHRN